MIEKELAMQYLDKVLLESPKLALSIHILQYMLSIKKQLNESLQPIAMFKEYPVEDTETFESNILNILEYLEQNAKELVEPFKKTIPKIQLTNNEKDAFYNPEDDKIYIYGKLKNKITFSMILLHEFIHAMTSKEIDPSSLTQRVLGEFYSFNFEFGYLLYLMSKEEYAHAALQDFAALIDMYIFIPQELLEIHDYIIGVLSNNPMEDIITKLVKKYSISPEDANNHILNYNRIIKEQETIMYDGIACYGYAIAAAIVKRDKNDPAIQPLQFGSLTQPISSSDPDFTLGEENQ